MAEELEQLKVLLAKEQAESALVRARVSELELERNEAQGAILSACAAMDHVEGALRSEVQRASAAAAVPPSPASASAARSPVPAAPVLDKDGVLQLRLKVTSSDGAVRVVLSHSPQRAATHSPQRAATPSPAQQAVDVSFGGAVLEGIPQRAGGEGEVGSEDFVSAPGAHPPPPETAAEVNLAPTGGGVYSVTTRDQSPLDLSPRSTVSGLSGATNSPAPPPVSVDLRGEKGGALSH